MGTITILNSQEYIEQPVPEVGKEYHIFDDGKIKPSRHGITTVVELIPFEECKDTELLDAWKCDVFDCNWLYAPETDYFVKTEFDDGVSYFVRTTDGGWFSLGYPDIWGGTRLDITGSLYDKMIEWFGEDCLE